MPTVPRLQESQVAPAGPTGARGNVSATPGDMGAGLGQGVNRLAGAIAQIAADEKVKADSLAVTDADARLSQWENTTLYDPENGALNTRGRDAFGLPDSVMGDYDAFVGEIEQGLANDAQRLAFRRMSTTRRSDIDRTISRHVASEYQKYDNDATNAALANSVEAAAANYQDPERIDAELGRQRAYIMSQAARTGEPSEVTQLKLSETTSTTHIAVIDRMLADRDYSAASEYYDAFGEEISATNRDEVENAINTGRLRGESQAKADELLGSGKTRSEALVEARAIDDPELRDETVRRVNARYDEVEAIQQEERIQNLQSATDTISQGGSVDDIDPGVWNSFTQTERSQLRALDARGEWYQDDAKWYDFIQKTPDEIAAMNLYTELRPYVDDQHWDRALAMQTASRGDRNDPALTSTLTFRQRLENTLSGTVFDDVNDLNDTDAARYARMENEAARRIELRELQLNRKLTGNEIQEEIDQMLIETVNLSNFFRDTTIPASAVLEDDKGDIYVPYADIPAEDLSSIENLILSNNRRVTRNKVERAYAAYLVNDPELFLRLTSE